MCCAAPSPPGPCEALDRPHEAAGAACDRRGGRLGDGADDRLAVIYRRRRVSGGVDADVVVSFGGEWRDGRRIVVIEQNGNELRASWKGTYTTRAMVCSGVWFEGAITGNVVSGVRYTCGPNSRPHALQIRIVDADTLDVASMSSGSGTTTRLKRVKWHAVALPKPFRRHGMGDAKPDVAAFLAGRRLPAHRVSHEDIGIENTGEGHLTTDPYRLEWAA